MFYGLCTKKSSSLCNLCVSVVNYFLVKTTTETQRRRDCTAATVSRDRAFVCASTGKDVSGLSPGQIVEITGFSGQFANDFEVDPRTQEDIRIITN